MKRVQSAALIALGLASGTLYADTIHVPGDYPTIQEALSVCQDGDTVLVADGTYTGDGNKNLDFDGKAITVRSENGPDNCIIDCERAGRGFYFYGGEAVVIGFTITHGNADYGGGIYCLAGSSPLIADCSVSDNTATNGGGIYCHSSSPVISECRISNNRATVADGGGIYCREFSNPTISRCAISENLAASGGGAVFSWSSVPTISECTISDNVATYGGALYCTSTGGSITNSNIRGNTATSDGGGIWCFDSRPTIRDCTITGNRASNRGGAIYCYFASRPAIGSCTISGNGAADGGAVFSRDSSPTIDGCILWNDTPMEIREIPGGSIAIRFSDVQGSWVGEGNIDSDPLFVDSLAGDYHLSSGSPCIETGCPWFTPTEDERDTDSQIRLWDADDDGLCVVDMGADEYDSIIPGDLDRDGCVGQPDLGILLSAWNASNIGDLDCDGETGQADLGILLAHWGEGCP